MQTKRYCAQSLREGPGTQDAEEGGVRTDPQPSPLPVPGLPSAGQKRTIMASFLGAEMSEHCPKSQKVNDRS